jgi:hypothetical protein
MSILLGFLVYLPSVLAGGLLIHQLWPGNQSARLLIKLGLGTGLGLGLTSMLYFLSLLIFNVQSGFLVIQLILLALGLALAWTNRLQNPIFPFPEKITVTRLQKLLLSAFGLLIVISIGSYFVHALMNPHGGFDAWMIYNRTARFFYRGGADWLTAFSPQIYWQFHADYPLFLSLNVAGAWNTLGSESMRAPQAHGAYMLFGIIFLLMGAVAFTRTTGQSLLAGLVLLGTPVFVYEGPREAADLTLSFFVLATVILFFLYQRKQKPILVTLAGFASGLAAWTKNEGLLFVLAVCLACAFIAFQLRNLKILIPFGLGLAFPGAVILYFKLFLAPSNDLFANTNQPSLLQLLTDMDRYRLIFSEFIDHIVWFGRSHISILALLLVYMLIVRLAPRASDHTAYLACASILAVQFFGYFAIYLVTPHDLDWHLRTSLGRLIMQLYPAALFLFFASLSDPETVFAK